MFLPGWSCLDLLFTMLLLTQKMFLGISRVVRMTTIYADEEETIQMV